MDNEKIVLSGSPIEIADFKEYKLATFLICVCDELDLNGRIIPKESAELYHSTIVGFPIVAKLVCNTAGDPVDFAGHEMYLLTDEDGNQTVRFGTTAIGSVVESWIEEREVAGYTGLKSCIMIKAKLWSDRYPEYFKVLDKLWSANNVKSSWELAVSEAIQTTRGKILKAFSFIGNALLGSSVIGAVPGAGVYEYAQLSGAAEDPEFELASALSKDIAVSNIVQGKEGDTVVDNDKTPVITSEDDSVTEPTQTTENADVVQSNEEGSEPAPAEPETKTETSALTDYDIREKIEDMHRKQTGLYGYVSWLFPAENKCWMRDQSCNDDTEIIVITYSVDGDVLSIVSEEHTRLTVSPGNMNEAIASRDDAIIKANERINELTATIAELTPYKEAAELAEQKRIEAETAAKREDFKARMLKSKLFAENEIEESESLKALINNLDEVALKSEIAERFMKSLDTDVAVTETTHETAEAVQNNSVRITITDESGEVDNETFMRHLLED